MKCYACKKNFIAPSPMPRSEECPHCSLDARVCLNCKFFKEGVSNQCIESEAEWVKEKDKSNFCGYFKAKSEGEDVGLDEKSQAMDALSKLFSR